jgi:hypothetical protein
MVGLSTGQYNVLCVAAYRRGWCPDIPLVLSEDLLRRFAAIPYRELGIRGFGITGYRRLRARYGPGMPLGLRAVLV